MNGTTAIDLTAFVAEFIASQTTTKVDATYCQRLFETLDRGLLFGLTRDQLMTLAMSVPHIG